MYTYNNIIYNNISCTCYYITCNNTITSVCTSTLLFIITERDSSLVSNRLLINK